MARKRWPKRLGLLEGVPSFPTLGKKSKRGSWMQRLALLSSRRPHRDGLESVGGAAPGQPADKVETMPDAVPGSRSLFVRYGEKRRMAPRGYSCFGCHTFRCAPCAGEIP